MPLAAVIACAAVLLGLLLPASGAFPSWELILAGFGFFAIRLVTPGADRLDDTLWPVVAGICSLGLLEVARIDAGLGRHQITWILVGLGIVVAGQWTFARYRSIARLKYFWVVASLALFILLRLFGQEVNGARLWFSFGSFEVQPVEFIKLFMVFFMAAYLAENGAAIGALAPMDLPANARLLGPLVLGWGVSIVTLVLQRDVGMAVLFLGTFLVMLYVSSRRLDLVAVSAAVFALGAWFVAAHFPYVQARIAVWHDPWSDPSGRGYQAEQALFALANGGLFGAGYHLGHPGFIPDAATDYVYAAWAEEFGVAGTLALLGLYLALVVRGMRIAFYADDRFTALLATGFAATLGIQVFVIVGGVLGLLPLTGITLPFFSYGGSSMVANLLMIDLLWLFSVRAGSPGAEAKVASSG
ncbi:MAG TPA: FtsW/RodA/SpoVE family cell cycle protein [Candidatus Eremiobacteraceae bacterium]|nr:FtsW/RodA/SpoVE family cell cycle protein [Candidatus Eremiobacteraceae bacterium]